MNRRNVLEGIGAAMTLGLAGCTGGESSDSTAEGSSDSDSSSSGNSGSSDSSGSSSSSDASDSSGSSNEQSSISDEYEYYESGIGLTDVGFTESEYGNLSLTGTATNTTDSELSYVQISVAFLDASGAQVGTSMANTNNLAPGQRWKWEAMFMDMDTSAVDSASITGIDAY